MISLLLALTLTWTAPSHTMRGDTLLCPLSWRLLRLAPQSATYRVWEPELRLGTSTGNVVTFRLIWPAVVRECAPQQVRSAAWLPGEQGKTMSVTLPDSLSGSDWIILHSDAAGESPSWSAIVHK